MAEHQVTNAFEYESDILKTLGCMAFILPHTLVRVVSFALVLAFLKYFATIPAAVGLITSTIIALVAARYDEDQDYHFAIHLQSSVSLPQTLLEIFHVDNQHLPSHLSSCNILPAQYHESRNSDPD